MFLLVLDTLFARGFPKLTAEKSESLYKTVSKKPDFETLTLSFAVVVHQSILKTIEEVPLIEATVMKDRDRERQFLDLDEETSARPLQEVHVDIELEGASIAQWSPAVNAIEEAGADDPCVGDAMVACRHGQ